MRTPSEQPRSLPSIWWVRGCPLAGDGDAYLTIATSGQQVCVSSPGGQPVALDAVRTQRLRHTLGWAMGAVLLGVRW